MASFAAARSVFRSAAAKGRAASSSKLAAGPKPASSPLRVPNQTQSCLSRPASFRPVMEMSRCVGSMLPYHSATASALLTSMLSVSNCTYGWTPEGTWPALICVNEIYTSSSADRNDDV